MAGKLTITLDNEHHVSVESKLQEQELYEAYVALTAHIAVRLKNKEDITVVANQAAKDALNMIELMKNQDAVMN